MPAFFLKIGHLRSPQRKEKKYLSLSCEARKGEREGISHADKARKVCD